jgi:hypothetical protein
LSAPLFERIDKLRFVGHQESYGKREI